MTIEQRLIPIHSDMSEKVRAIKDPFGRKLSVVVIPSDMSEAGRQGNIEIRPIIDRSR